ncbi:unnamed protein product, partial [Staurois parvus]
MAMAVGLLAAGSETTATTLTFCLIFLAHYSEVQAKVQQEIDEVTQSLRLYLELKTDLNCRTP